METRMGISWGEEQQDSPCPWITFTKSCAHSHRSPAFSICETHWQKYIPLRSSVKLQQTYLYLDCFMNTTGRSGSKSSGLAHNCHSYPKLMHDFSGWLSQEFGCLNPTQVILKEDQGCNARYLRNEEASELKQSARSLFCLLLHIMHFFLLDPFTYSEHRMNLLKR